MAQIPNLQNGALNFTSIRDQSQKELITILKNIRGKKSLVIDPKLGGSLSLVVQTSVLKEYGAELHHLTAEPIQTNCTKVVYLVQTQLHLMKYICSHIHNDTSKGLQREYFVYFVPRRAVACEKILEEEKVHNLLTIGEFPLYIIPLDEDVLSFELDLSYKECLVDGDTTSLWHIAKAIHKLEFSFGLIPNVRAKGKASVRIADMLDRMQAEEPVNSTDLGMPEINTLILLDRELDMVTPVCSQLTYEGLLDEFFYINNGAVELDASIMGATQQDGKKIKVPLNSTDKLFRETRDLNFEVVVQVLRQKATSMKQDYTEMTTTNQTVSELKDFVKKLNSLPEMTRHINLAQHLSTSTSKPSFLARLDMEHTIVEAESYDICFEHIEEMIHKQEPLVSVLRLLILFSVTNAGLPKKNFDYLRREILHSYGFEHIATLNNLEKAGLVRKQGIPPVSKNLKDSDAWVVAVFKKLTMWWPWVAEGNFPLTTAKGAEVASYNKLDPTVRLTILKALCEIRADQHDVVSCINDSVKRGIEVSSFQKSKIGGDGKGTSYWCDGNESIGLRLYKEVNSFPRNGVLPAITCQWETLATNLEEFQKVVDEFSCSKSKVEVAVAKAVEADAIPVLIKLQKKKQRALKQRQREEKLINGFCRSITTRSCRNRRPISYTFDEYDKAIDEAIRETKKRKTRECQGSEKNGKVPQEDPEQENQHIDGESTVSDTESDEHEAEDISEDSSEESGGEQHDSEIDDKENMNHGNKSRSTLKSQKQAGSLAENTKRSKKITANAGHSAPHIRNLGAKNRLRQRPTRNTALESAVVPDSEDDISSDSSDS